MLNLVHPDRQPVRNSNFQRYVGYDDKTEMSRMLSKLYTDAAAGGVCITSPIPNPSQNELSKLMTAVNFNRTSVNSDEVLEDMLTLSQRGMVKLDNYIKGLQPKDAADTVYAVIRDAAARSVSQSAFKNTYVKLICWLARYSEKPVNSVLYINDEVSKYDIYYLYLLSRLGLKVTMFSFSDNGAYAEADPSGVFSETTAGNLHEKFELKFSKLDPKNLELIKKMYETFTPQVTRNVQNITTSVDKLPEDIIESHFQRISSRGNHFNKSELTPVIPQQ